MSVPPVVGTPGIQLELGVLGYNSRAPRFAMHFDNVTIDLP